MVEPAHWFQRGEYLARLERVQERLRERHLVALLAFQPETVTYLTGFFTRGYGSFQFAIVPAEGEPCLVCRDMEAYYLDSTCVFEDRELWSDSDPKIEVALRAVTRRIGRAGRVGIELASWQLNAKRHAELREALPDLELVDASDLVSRLRLIKSAAEIDYQRRAAAAAAAGMRAAVDTARPGTSERVLAAEICAAMIRAGSDLPGPGVLSSGERAFHLHGGYSDRVIEEGDHVQVETTPNVRHYHARFMRPIKAGSASDADHETVARLVEIQDRAIAEVGPGVAASVPDRIYREGVLNAGLAESYTNKTFYSVGLLLQPSGGEPLEAAPGATWRFEPGMTFHTYVLARGFGMSETITVTESGHEKLTDFPRQLFVTT
ncbi:MAG: Xaa-Pro peptidase family protein [Kiloniellales bacterium]|nr:Xaa-Pro peptidase family protein [Kiloniellales bacterium]